MRHLTRIRMGKWMIGAAGGQSANYAFLDPRINDDVTANRSLKVSNLRTKKFD